MCIRTSAPGQPETCEVLDAKPVREEGRRGRLGRAQPVTAQRLAAAVEAAKAWGQQVMQKLLAELEQRFPPHDLLGAFSIFYMEYWLPSERTTLDGRRVTSEPPSDEDVASKVRRLRQFYCTERTIVSEAGEPTTISSLLDDTALQRQLPAFISLMRKQAPIARAQQRAELAKLQKKAKEEAARLAGEGVQPSEVQADLTALLGPSATVLLWRGLSNSTAPAAMSEYIKAASIVLTMVGGGVEDERVFSSLSFIMNDLRTRLGEDHLNACVGVYLSRSRYTLSSFPYKRAYEAWLAARKGGRRSCTADKATAATRSAAEARQQQQQKEQQLVLDLTNQE
jgi:hypothetical protein